MSIHLKSVVSIPAGDCRLEQPEHRLHAGDTPTQLRATYLVRHTGDQEYRTYVFNDLTLDVEVPGRVTDPRCRAIMHIETPWMESPGAAVDKLAEWLERFAKGMRDGTAREGFGVELVAAQSAHPTHDAE